jgi:ribosomal protein L31E
VKEELEVMLNKEKDYLITIRYLRSNLESMTRKAEEQVKAITELVERNTQLKEENKVTIATLVKDKNISEW